MKIVFRAILLALPLFAYQNCDVVRPSVENTNMASVATGHTGLETTCLPCHEPDRPPLGLAVPLNAFAPISQSVHTFNHLDTFGGQGDCVNCHANTPRTVGRSWADGLFDHTDSTTGATVTTCAQCHTPPAATPSTSPAIGYDHSTITQDCSSCHTLPGVSWKQGASHTHALTDSCASCHVGERPAANIFKPNLATKNLFSHTAIVVGASDCNRCHTHVPANLGVTFSGGYFDHKDAQSKSVTSCLPCHSQGGADRPTGLVGGATYKFDHAVAGQGDCATCHTLATWGTATPWNDGQYAHNPLPMACATCHAGNRPAATTLLPSAPAPVALNQSKAQFLHKTNYGGLNDCYGCHTATVNNAGKTWTGGYFDHFDNTGTKIATCVECHTRPAGSPTSNPPVAYDHSTIGTQDCSSCHSRPGVTWADASGAHTHNLTNDTGKCYMCHTGDMPAATTLKTVYTNKNYFGHASNITGTIGQNGADCSRCHLAAPANLGVTWSGAYFDHKAQAGTGLTSCMPCHSTGVDRPTGPVGKNLNGPLGAYKYDHANGGTGDCITCHTTGTVGTATPWADGNYVHTPLPTSCSTCHKQKPADTTRLPATATVVHMVYFHAAGYNGTADCATCHSKVPANAGTTWAGGLYNHTSTGTTQVTTCSACHSGYLPAAATAYPSTLKDSFVHATNYVGTTGECKGCHSPANTNTGAITAWANGKWANSPYGNHNTTSGTKVTTCLPCHSNRYHNAGRECYSCHKNAGVNWNHN